MLIFITIAVFQELFAPYNIDTATIHLNEQGVSLGTGDVYLRKKDALQMFEDFRGVSLDGKYVAKFFVQQDLIKWSQYFKNDFWKSWISYDEFSI